jgi:hypothetical protein
MAEALCSVHSAGTPSGSALAVSVLTVAGAVGLDVLTGGAVVAIGEFSCVDVSAAGGSSPAHPASNMAASTAVETKAAERRIMLLS